MPKYVDRRDVNEYKRQYIKRNNNKDRENHATRRYIRRRRMGQKSTRRENCLKCNEPLPPYTFGRPKQYCDLHSGWAVYTSEYCDECGAIYIKGHITCTNCGKVKIEFID